MRRELWTEETSLPTRLDRLPVTRLHLLCAGVAVLGMAADMAEMALSGGLAAVFSSPAHRVGSAQLSLLLSSIYVGAVIGTPLLGRLGDLHGRRNVLAGLLLWAALMSVLAGFSRGIGELTVARGLSGLAIGAYPPLMIAFLTDLLPPARRGALMVAVMPLATVGPVGILLALHALTPLAPLGLEGWRWVFLLLGAVCALSSALYLALPESPRWLHARGHAQRAQAALAAFESSRVLLPATPAREPLSLVGDAPALPATPWRRIAGLFLLSPWPTVAFPILSGAMLAQKGFRLDDTLLYVGLASIGPALGSLAGAAIVDRFDRRAILAGTVVAMMVTGAIFAMGQTPLVLVLANALFGAASVIYLSALNLYVAELVPTASRAGVLANAWTLNRVGAAIAPLVLIPLLRSAGVPSMMSIIGIFLGLGAALLWRMPPGRQRQRLG